MHGFALVASGCTCVIPRSETLDFQDEIILRSFCSTMQKNDKVYTFLLTRSSKKRIYIRRVEVAKNLLHFGSVGLFLLTGSALLGLGLSGVVRNTVLAKNLDNSQIASQIATAEMATVVTSQPGPSELAANAGGPESADEADSEDAAIDSELREAAASLDPAFLPTVWPHLGKINNEFGFRRNPFGGRTYEFHPGMDIDGERGELVYAPGNGTVIKAGWTGGYGNMIEIDHGNGITTRYGHLSKGEVEVGDEIVRGQEIGLIGSTGRSTGPHLHFELRLDDRSINPRHFLPPEPINIEKK